MRLADFANRKPAQLSGGQQQRVALARALVNYPSALLLDEPLGALDLKLRQAMQLELKRIQREVGITFVFVTHDQEEALTMSDRIAVMSEGRVEQIGAPRGDLRRARDRCSSPASSATANLFRSRSIGRDGDDATVDVSRAQRLPRPDGADAARVGDAATLMVRPERVQCRSWTSRDHGHVGAAVHRQRPRVPGPVVRVALDDRRRHRDRRPRRGRRAAAAAAAGRHGVGGLGARRGTPARRSGRAVDDRRELDDDRARGGHHEVPSAGTSSVATTP